MLPGMPSSARRGCPALTDRVSVKAGHPQAPGERGKVDPPVNGALTDPAGLAQRIYEAGGAKGVAVSVAWLMANAADLRMFTSVEDWAAVAGGGGPFPTTCYKSVPNSLGSYGSGVFFRRHRAR
jgi:hypothetical protein